MAKPLFRFNTRQLSAALQREIMREPVRARRAMDAVGGFLNGEAKDLAPVDEGFLTGEISNLTVNYRRSYAAVIYIPGNGQSAQYAIAMHEGFYRIGAKSTNKQSKVGKVVGRKFITRALDNNITVIGEIIRREMRI